MNSSTRLAYKSCRNDGTSALKLAEIVWKNKQVTVVLLCFFIYEAGNFWNNPRSNHLYRCLFVYRCMSQTGKLVCSRRGRPLAAPLYPAHVNAGGPYSVLRALLYPGPSRSRPGAHADRLACSIVVQVLKESRRCRRARSRLTRSLRPASRRPQGR